MVSLRTDNSHTQYLICSGFSIIHVLSTPELQKIRWETHWRTDLYINPNTKRCNATRRASGKGCRLEYSGQGRPHTLAGTSGTGKRHLKTPQLIIVATSRPLSSLALLYIFFLSFHRFLSPSHILCVFIMMSYCLCQVDVGSMKTGVFALFTVSQAPQTVLSI